MADRATTSELQKAQIHVLDRRGNQQDVIPVLFNPSEYRLKKTVEYGEQNVTGLTTPVTQFASGNAETLSMELFFDTYERNEDVRTYTDRLDDLLAVDGDLHAPPICRFVWGSLNFKAVLERAEKRFTMFLPDGIPVRARVKVRFREYKTPEEQTTERKRHSADKTKVRRVTEGETLWLIAADEYGDPSKWRPIAEENDIDNPRDLRAGVELVVPPLEP